jgi:uncharacterized protein (DUF4415 family)
MKDEDIDYSDIPPLTDEILKNAKVVRLWEPKKAISVRLDNDLLEWFRSQGKGYQTKINAVLRRYASANGMRKLKQSPR